MGPSVIPACLRVHVAACLLALSPFSALSLFPSEAHGDDVYIDAESTFVAYEVRSPGTTAFLASRRFVQRLGARYSVQLNDDEERPIRFQTSLRLRLDRDFGDECLITRELCVRATDASDPAGFQPLAQGTRLDAPEAWVGLRGLPGGGSLRVGRQLRMSPIGFRRFDGASLEVAPTNWLRVDAFGGSLVRRTTFAGTGNFEPLGAYRLDQEALPSAARSFVREPTTTWMFGGSATVGRSRAVVGRVAYRELREEDGLVFRRGAVSLASQPLDALRLEAAAIFDLLDGAVVDAHGLVELLPSEALRVALEVERHLPRFDPGTIWGYFDLVPIHEGELRASWDLSDDVELGAGLRGRMADLGEGRGGTEVDVGGRGWLRTAVEGVRLSVEGFIWDGDLGPMAALLLTGSRRLSSWLGLDARASVWHFEDPLRPGLYGASVSEGAGVSFRMSDTTILRGDLQHAYSRLVGHRFRGLVQLTVEVWR